MRLQGLDLGRQTLTEAKGFLSIAKDQSNFSGFPVKNFIESLIKCSITKLKRKPMQFQDVFIAIEEIIEIFIIESKNIELS